jgi:DNA-binding transcriptional regulator YiaG
VPKKSNKNTRTPAMDPLSLRALRESLDMTQAKFAALVGVSRQTLNRWESGLTVINPIHAAALRDALRRHTEGAVL